VVLGDKIKTELEIGLLNILAPKTIKKLKRFIIWRLEVKEAIF
jgi:hypothetical protein